MFTESFDDGFGAFTNRWGHTDWTPGQITVTSIEGEWGNSGAMIQGEGFGYGKFEFDAASRQDIVGPHLTMWPANDIWPGPEIGAMEIRSNGEVGRLYANRHYDAHPGYGGNEDDRWGIYEMDRSIDPTLLHTYRVDWAPDLLAFYTDDQLTAIETEHVPLDAAHGGVNTLPGVGEQTWWAAALQDGDNAVTLTEFRYTPLSDWNLP